MVAICCSGDWIKLAAATMAASHSPASSAVHARCSPYSDEEHAVSSTKLSSALASLSVSQIYTMVVPRPGKIQRVADPVCKDRGTHTSGVVSMHIFGVPCLHH